MNAPSGLFRPLDSRARLVTVFFWCYIATTAGLIVALIASFAVGLNLYSEETPSAEETPVGSAASVVGGLLLLLWFFIFVISAVVYLMWLHRARSNLPALGVTDVRWSPAWSIAWWFIPIMSLFRPYQVVKETWQASDPAALPTWRRENPPPWFLWWWVMFLIDSFGGSSTDQVDQSMGGTPDFGAGVAFPYVDMAVMAAGIGAAYLAIRIVRDITQRQTQRYQVRAFA